MENKAVICALASLLVALVIVLNYPLDTSIEFQNFIFLIPFFILEGAILAIFALTNLNWIILAVSFLLAAINRHAIAVGAWILLGVIKARSSQRNLINPDLRLATRELFSAPFMLMALISILFIYPTLRFEIPDSLLDVAVDMTLNTYGKALPCGPQDTLQTCVDSSYSSYVEKQCNGEPSCIALLQLKESELKESIRNEIVSQFPELSSGKTLREAVKDSIRAPINSIMQKYENLFKVVTAVGILFTFQLIGKISSPVSYLLAVIFLKLFKKTGLIKEKTEKVDKVIYEA